MGTDTGAVTELLLEATGEITEGTWLDKDDETRPSRKAGILGIRVGGTRGHGRGGGTRTGRGHRDSV